MQGAGDGKGKVFSSGLFPSHPWALALTAWGELMMLLGSWGWQKPAARPHLLAGEEGSEDMGGSGTGLTYPGQKLGFFI